MRTLLLAATAAVLAGGSLRADMRLVYRKHTDAYTLRGKDTPAAETTSTTWIGKDKLRFESESVVCIVRLDQKKLLLLDPQQKTWSPIDLPFDATKHVPPDDAARVTQFVGARALQAKVTPSDATQTFGAWKARRHDIGLAQAGNSVSHEIVWASQDVKVDAANYVELMGAFLSLDPAFKNLAPELRKIEGVPVHRAKQVQVTSVEVKSVEELVSAEEKEPAAGLYDAPADYVEKPFDVYSALRITRKPAPASKPGG